jgi:hypothetical protein
LQDEGRVLSGFEKLKVGKEVIQNVTSFPTFII